MLQRGFTTLGHSSSTAYNFTSAMDLPSSRGNRDNLSSVLGNNKNIRTGSKDKRMAPNFMKDKEITSTNNLF